MNLAAAILVICLVSVCRLATAKVILMGKNVTLSFDDVEANFTPLISSSGESGVLYAAEPLDACSDLTNDLEKVSIGSSPFALIIRGGCTFEDKVRWAQKAGFRAAVVYDNEDGGILVSMAGNPSGVKIHAVFVSKESGEILQKYAGSTDMELSLIPTFENSAWSIMAISFISLLAMSAVLATCFFVRRHRVRRRRRQASRVREFRGMSSRLVQAMPSLIFTAVLDDSCTSSTCAICLEDYSVGDKLRILPCHHKFHAICVDSWLTTWRTFCPVCKRDARTNNGEPPASESTPLLSSSPVSASSSFLSPSRSPLQSLSNIIASASSSFLSPSRSSLQSSSNIIAPPSRSPSVSLSHSPASTQYLQQSRRSYRRSPPMHVSQSSADLRNAYSQRSRVSHLASSPQSLGYSPTSPLNTRYMSQYRPSLSNASPTPVGSSSTYLQQSERSYRRSPPIPVSRSSLDLRNAYSQRYCVSHLGSSPHSLGYPLSSPLNTRYMPHYRPSPSNASTTPVGSSSYQAHPLRFSESAGTFSPFASANSLPEC